MMLSTLSKPLQSNNQQVSDHSTETAESITLLIDSFLENFNACQDVGVMQRECRGPTIPFQQLTGNSTGWMEWV